MVNRISVPAYAGPASAVAWSGLGQKFRSCCLRLEVEISNIVKACSRFEFLVWQRCNHWEIYGATSAMVGQNLPPPPGWNRVKASENLGGTCGYVPVW